jgi:hypothetical protein
MLDRLGRVEFCEILETEEQDFTPWIADKENINILGDALNMDLNLRLLKKASNPLG